MSYNINDSEYYVKLICIGIRNYCRCFSVKGFVIYGLVVVLFVVLNLVLCFYG